MQQTVRPGPRHFLLTFTRTLREGDRGYSGCRATPAVHSSLTTPPCRHPWGQAARVPLNVTVTSLTPPSSAASSILSITNVQICLHTQTSGATVPAAHTSHTFPASDPAICLLSVGGSENPSTLGPSQNNSRAQMATPVAPAVFLVPSRGSVTSQPVSVAGHRHSFKHCMNHSQTQPVPAQGSTLKCSKKPLSSRD